MALNVKQSSIKLISSLIHWIWPPNIIKKSLMPNSWGRPLFWPRPFPNMGKKPTFDRKVVQTQFFYQNDRNWLLKRFPSVRGHFALKCFLNGLIGQLVILGRISQNITMLTSVRYLRGISYPNILQWVVRITKKKLQAQFHPEDLFLVVTPMPKYGQKSTFDRKVVETQFFNQNDRNWILKRFPSAQGHFALKFFLYGLIRQLVILTRIRLNFTMLTSVWYLRGISYPRVLQWALRITKKVTFSTPAIQKTLFGFLGWRLCPNMVKS